MVAYIALFVALPRLRLAVLAAGPLALILVVASAKASTPLHAGSSLGALQFHAALRGRFADAPCPDGTPNDTVCVSTSGTGTARGLGSVSTRYLNFRRLPGSSCEFWHSNPVLAVSGKGEIDLAVTTPAGVCVVDGTFEGVMGSLVFTVTGGSGSYAGASGSGTFVIAGIADAGQTDTLDGTITVPGLDFDPQFLRVL
jgi:hypothetical protein